MDNSDSHPSTSYERFEDQQGEGYSKVSDSTRRVYGSAIPLEDMSNFQVNGHQQGGTPGICCTSHWVYTRNTNFAEVPSPHSSEGLFGG